MLVLRYFASINLSLKQPTLNIDNFSTSNFYNITYILTAIAIKNVETRV